jgi:hypothetical protein
MNARGTYRLGWVATAAAVLATAGPASAFYWKGWPGSGIRTETTIIPPTDNQPPTDKPPIDQPPPEYPPPEYPLPPPPPPEQVPEPGTAVVGLIGLGAVAVVRRLRKR